MEDETSAAEELEYIRDLMTDLDLSPRNRLQDLIDGLEGEIESQESCDSDD